MQFETVQSKGMMFLLLVAFMLMVDEGGVAALDSEKCKVTNCKRYGPPVRFPFWLKDQRCGYPDPGFQLSCSQNKQTMLHLPRSVKMAVQYIDYEKQTIDVSGPDGETCLYQQLPSLNLSASPFIFFEQLQNITLFNCSEKSDKDSYGVDACPIIALPSDTRNNFNLVNCTKFVDISAVPRYFEFGIRLQWSKPLCLECEAQGRSCRLKNVSTPPQTECYDTPKPSTQTGLPTKDKKKKESQSKIEKFLEDYKAFKPSRYSFADIKRITNEFKDKLGQGGYGTVFKGRLSNDVLVAVKILNDSNGNGEEFINEVGSMSRIHHVNVTRLVGFCADGYKRALVYEYLPNESLEKFIFAAKGENHVLGWNKLQDIALGIAKGIEYLHQGCEQRILHFDIKPHNILLDQNFNPKISDFGLAKLCSKDQSAVSMTAARGTMGYIAPEVLSRNFGNVSYKSDVYSFGMLLLEMVGGRKNIDVTVENTSQVYFPEWAYNHLDNGEETGIRIENESHSEIERKLTIVGLWCIQWYPVDRPSMKVVIQMLEGEADSLTKPPNPFASADHMKMSAFKYKKPVNIELAVIAE
ncbi:rust resistance kinase Lr10 isoform X2 [Gossypium hirsutum]|uniref:Rust resistance kinase Lr10 isoform X2 n=1 Tax=Gossypium hirsutum TaxID=3635 RepID=A0A1U8I884_GOSHI|nr:rust resistance kinase Lr10-like isoform X2 [Gossypium hirsutum]